MEEVKSVNFFNITKAKNESYQSFLTKLIAIWDDSVYSKTSTSSILKDKILDNVNNDEFRQQILAAKDVDMPKFLALCMSFDSLEVKMDELKMAEDAKILEEKKSESFFLPISEVVLKYLPEDTVAALRSLLADNSEFVRKMYNDMDTAVLEFIAMRDTIKKSLDLIKTDLNNGRWDKFPDTITVSSMNTFIHGQSNSLDVFVQYAAGNLVTFEESLRIIDRLKTFKITKVDSNVIVATHIDSGISCNLICSAPCHDATFLQSSLASFEKSKFIAFFTLWLENCLKEKSNMTKNMKLILWYLRTYFPNSSSGQQRKYPEFDFKKNLIKFMSSVYNMQPGSTYNKDVTSLMASNKEFFKASAVFMEYVD